MEKKFEDQLPTLLRFRRGTTEKWNHFLCSDYHGVHNGNCINLSPVPLICPSRTVTYGLHSCLCVSVIYGLHHPYQLVMRGMSEDRLLCSIHQKNDHYYRQLPYHGIAPRGLFQQHITSPLLSDRSNSKVIIETSLVSVEYSTRWANKGPD